MRIRIDDNLIEGLKSRVREALEASPGDAISRALLEGVESSEADAAAGDRDEILEAAERLFCDNSDNDIEIDPDAVFSRGDDGVWVSAWVHVAHAELATAAGDEDGDADQA